MASADVLSQTLTSITAIKLDEISNQRASFESRKTDLLARIKNEPSQRGKVEILLNEIEDLGAMGKIDGPLTSLSNARQFVEQSVRDPSVTDQLLNDTQRKLEKQLEIHSLKYEYASLYGRLVTEWLSVADMEAGNGSGSDTGSVFEKIGRKEMHDQRITWEDYVFKPLETDTEAIEATLTKLFSSTKSISKAYNAIRAETAHFEATLKSTKGHFDVDSLKGVIEGLLRSDLVTDEKRKVLNDFISNKIVLAEIADVLNMRMGALEHWRWDPKGTVVEQRRMLNGRYRFYHDEDLLQAILLRYIGTEWSIHFAQALKEFQETLDVWKPSSVPVPKADRQRRDYFLGTNKSTSPSMESHRSDQYNELFLEQLVHDADEKRGGYDDDNESQPGDTRKSGHKLTQDILHTLAAEIIVKSRLGEDISVVRTDYKWFGPSLSHSTMAAVLSFFGVSSVWLGFFQRVLEAPMKFLDDGPNAPIQIRKRGTPISGPMSDMLGETVLFCLDFAFNQQTGGARLYRLHDDIWFWGNDKICEKGWETMVSFSNLMGLEFSEEKTGSVKITRKRDGRKLQCASSKLPKGDVTWGFLKLDAETGRFLINQAKVDTHVEELALQLNGCKSVFEFIQAWNIYACRFFATNFGSPVQAYGKAHIDMILDAYSEIQARLFTKSGGSITNTLKGMISERFGVENIPEGYLYFPTSLGGLELKNPFVDLYLVRGSASDNPDSYMDTFFEHEEMAYKAAKDIFEKGTVPGQASLPHALTSKLSGDPFMSFQEYTRYREQTSTLLYSEYIVLLAEPAPRILQQTSDVAARIERHILSKLTSYNRWIIQLYGPDVIARFGGLTIVDKGLLPTGMVKMFQEARFKWQG